MGGRSLIQRIDRDRKSLLGTNPGRHVTGTDVYRDVNRYLGLMFKMFCAFFNLNVPGITSTPRKHSHAHKRKKGWF